MNDGLFCGCGDEITAADPGVCGTCNSIKDGQIERLRAELVAAQAYAERLREALKESDECVSACEGVSIDYYIRMIRCNKTTPVEDALALPADSSALTERLAQERERIVGNIELANKTARSFQKKLSALEAMLPNICQLIDAAKAEWSQQGCWSEWDQSVRDGLTRYNIDAALLGDPQ